ncbi:MAG: TMEM43 family protein [Bacteroidaceae bacterium]|nr:TMEM43 family protein [Bacteroidaceae bacterium]
MAYTETTTTGYGTRVGRSFKSIGSGFLLFIAGTALLWWNEGRAVKTDKMLNEAEGATVEMENPNKIDPAMDGELVIASALATTQDSLVDDQFNLGATAISLTRKVEYYQWVEHSQEKSEDKLGGKEVTTTTYTYDKQWVSQPVQSSQFKDPAYQEKNYVLFSTEDQRVYAENVTFGAYKLNESQIHSISSTEPVLLDLADSQLQAWDNAAAKIYVRYNGNQIVNQPAQEEVVADSALTVIADSIPQDNKKDYDYVHQVGNVLYFGLSADSPQVGDVRITFEKVVPAVVTIIAQVKGDTFKPYKAKNGKKFSTLRMGKQDADEIYESEHEQNNMFLWIWRIVGILLVIGGLKGLFGFLITILKVVPMVANIVSFGVGIICTVIGLVWSLLIIALAWLFYRPLIGITLLVIAGFLIWVFAFKGKDKLKQLANKNQPQPESPAV